MRREETVPCHDNRNVWTKFFTFSFRAIGKGKPLVTLVRLQSVVGRSINQMHLATRPYSFCVVTHRIRSQHAKRRGIIIGTPARSFVVRANYRAHFLPSFQFAAFGEVNLVGARATIGFEMNKNMMFACRRCEESTSSLESERQTNMFVRVFCFHNRHLSSAH